MKRIGLTFLTLIFAGTVALPGAWAGVDYIKYHQEFRARQEAAEAPQRSQQGHRIFHKSKYQREEATGQGTVVPTSNKPRPAHKYDRPDWAK